jgi:hypothetical protein
MRISAWAGLLVKSPPPKIAIKQIDETNTHLEVLKPKKLLKCPSE